MPVYESLRVHFLLVYSGNLIDEPKFSSDFLNLRDCLENLSCKKETKVENTYEDLSLLQGLRVIKINYLFLMIKRRVSLA